MKLTTYEMKLIGGFFALLWGIYLIPELFELNLISHYSDGVMYRKGWYSIPYILTSLSIIIYYVWYIVTYFERKSDD